MSPADSEYQSGKNAAQTLEEDSLMLQWLLDNCEIVEREHRWNIYDKDRLRLIMAGVRIA